MNKLHNAFDDIKADAKTKENTLAYVIREIQSKQIQPKGLVRNLRLVSAALCVVFLLFFSAGTYAFAFYPASYISVDINPSVEITLNRLGKVIDADSYNKDGEKILEGLSLNWKAYDEALHLIVDKANSEGFMDGDSWVQFSVSTSNEAIYDKVSGFCRDNGYNGGCRKASGSEIASAHEHNISFGKYQSYLELIKVAPSYTLEDVRNMTMAEIHSLIESNCGQVSGGNGSGSCNGQTGENQQGSETGGHGSGSGHGNDSGHGSGSGHGGDNQQGNHN